MNLLKLGWNNQRADMFASFAEPTMVPARVLSVDKSSYNLGGDFGEVVGKLSGRYRYTASSEELPAVGDWVAVSATTDQDDFAMIHQLLDRTSCLARKVVGTATEAQIIASNIDVVFIMTGLDQNFNLRRIERYIALIKNCGAQPVIVLNKADLLTDPIEMANLYDAIESVAINIPYHFISLKDEQGLGDLTKYLIPGKTVALVGSSGVGKSTLTNYFLGEDMQRVVETRADDSRGRHTTTRRQLFLLPSGCMLIDTPGMREIQLWIDGDNFDSGFADIDQIKQNCKFKDCTHGNEPGCAVQKAIEMGELDSARLQNLNKMKRELNYLEKRQNETGWDSRLADRQFGRFRNSVLRNKNPPR